MGLLTDADHTAHLSTLANANTGHIMVLKPAMDALSMLSMNKNLFYNYQLLQKGCFSCVKTVVFSFVKTVVFSFANSVWVSSGSPIIKSLKARVWDRQRPRAVVAGRSSLFLLRPRCLATDRLYHLGCSRNIHRTCGVLAMRFVSSVYAKASHVSPKMQIPIILCFVSLFKNFR